MALDNNGSSTALNTSRYVRLKHENTRSSIVAIGRYVQFYFPLFQLGFTTGEGRRSDNSRRTVGAQ